MPSCHEVPLNGYALHTECMPEPFRTLPRKPLLLLAAAIVLMGLFAAWWFSRAQQPLPQHPETALFRQIDETRVLLADIFRSQDREAAIASTLEAAGLTVQRTLRERPMDSRYPPRRITVFVVPNYRHLDSEGILELTFFNDRLMEADFRPTDAARYAPRLRSAYPGMRSIGTGHAELQDGALRIWSSVELAKSQVGRTLGTEGRVLWTDQRLTAQLDDWDARFGHIPVPSKR